MRPGGRAAAAVILAGGLVAAAATAQAYTRSSITIDARSGLVLQAHNADALHPPASLSKMMTLYLTFEAIAHRRFGWNTRVRISRYAATRQPSKVYLRVGERVRVRDLVYATALKSANDAATALAEKVAGSERRFAQRMTRKARQLGMRHTVFGTASGLPARGQRTTARDMAILARSLIHHFPQYADVFSTGYYRFGRRKFRNTNRLLRSNPHVNGMKTGYTRRARYNLVTSARKGGIRLITVVLGARTSRHRYRKTRALLAHGWRTAHNSAYLRKRPHGYVRIAGLEGGGSGDARRRVAANAGARTGKSSLVAALPRKRQGGRRIGLSLTAAAAAAPRPAREPVRRPAAGRAIHAVQVGAYYRRHQAQTALRRAVRALPKSYRNKASRKIVGKRAGKRSLFLARLTGFGRREAQRACVSLRRRGIDCLPVWQAAAAGAPTQEAVVRRGARPGYAIQVGAFSDYKWARHGLKRAHRILPGRLAEGTRDRILAKRNRSRRAIYRARITGLSFSEAREACVILKRRNLDCMPLRVSASS